MDDVGLNVLGVVRVFLMLLSIVGSVLVRFCFCVVGIICCLLCISSLLLNSKCKCFRVWLIVDEVRFSLLVVCLMFFLCKRMLSMIRRFKLMLERVGLFILNFIYIK